MIDTVPFVVDLMRKNYEAVGFIQSTAVEFIHSREQVLVQYENDDPCGYLIHGTGYPLMRVYQVCMCFDARRQLGATNLIHQLVAKAESFGCSGISLWCADDLDANQFWQAIGAQYVGQRIGGRKRGRMHNRYFLTLSNSRQTSFDFGGIIEVDP